MAKNYVCDGNVMDYLNTGAAIIASGAVVPMAAMIGVADANIAPGQVGAVSIVGVFNLPKKTGSGAALTAGGGAWWDGTNKQIVGAAADGLIPAGKVFADAGDSAATVRIKINA